MTDAQIRSLFDQGKFDEWHVAIGAVQPKAAPAAEVETPPPVTAPAQQFATCSWTEKYFVTDEYLKRFIKAILKAVANSTREFVEEKVSTRIKALEDKTSGMAGASILAQQAERICSLETRLAQYEKRLANLDNTANAHRRHLENLEKKFGEQKHAGVI